MFKALKDKLASASSKFNGNTDFLEAVCAGCALVAAADGDVSDDEIDSTLKAVAANAVLSNGFSSPQITRTAEAMLKRAAGGRVGRSGLYAELDDIAANHDMAEAVVLATLDVAESDGNIDADEKVVLEKIAERLKVNLKKLMEV